MSNIEEEIKTVDMQTFAMDNFVNEEEEAEIEQAIKDKKAKEIASIKKAKQMEIIKGLLLGFLLLGAFITADQLGLLKV